VDGVCEGLTVLDELIDNVKLRVQNSRSGKRRFAETYNAVFWNLFLINNGVVEDRR
jgi:hypothetical protein